MMKKIGIFLVIIFAISFCPMSALPTDLDDIHRDLQSIDTDLSFQEGDREVEEGNALIKAMKAMAEQGQSNRELELYKAFLNGDSSPEAVGVAVNILAEQSAKAIKELLPRIKKEHDLPMVSGNDLYASELCLNDVFFQKGWKTKEEHDSLVKILGRDFGLELNFQLLGAQLAYGIITRSVYAERSKGFIDDYKNKRDWAE